MMPFELFRADFRNHKHLARGPEVKLYQSGKIALNRAAYEALGSPVELHLLFDPDRRMVGLKPVPEGTANGYRINQLRFDADDVIEALDAAEDARPDDRE